MFQAAFTVIKICIYAVPIDQPKCVDGLLSGNLVKEKLSDAFQDCKSPFLATLKGNDLPLLFDQVNSEEH
jgi:hypothetical protein